MPLVLINKCRAECKWKGAGVRDPPLLLLEFTMLFDYEIPRIPTPARSHDHLACVKMERNILVSHIAWHREVS